MILLMTAGVSVAVVSVNKKNGLNRTNKDTRLKILANTGTLRLVPGNPTTDDDPSTSPVKYIRLAYTS